MRLPGWSSGQLPRYAVALSTLVGCAWLVSCTEALPDAPLPPIVIAPALVNSSPITLRGTKQASTAIVLSNGETLVPLDENTYWSASVTLRDGSNAFSLAALDALERSSTFVNATVMLDDVPPDAPTLQPVAPTTLKDEVTLTGTKDPSDRLEVNGSVRPTGADNVAFSIDVALALGENLVRVATLDQAGNESSVLELVVERVAQVPFTVTTPPALVGAAPLTISGTRAAGVEVLLAGNVVAAAATTSGSWSHDVTLAPGANQLSFAGRIALEPDSSASVVVEAFYDDADPELAVITPVAGQLIDASTLGISGTIEDASAVTVEVCVGACAIDTDFEPALVTSGTFATTIDLAARADLLDGALADVVVRATDAVQRRSTIVTGVLIARAPVELPAASDLDLASGAFYVEARAFIDANGAAQVQLDIDGAPWAAHTVQISDATAAWAGAPQVVLMPSGAAAVLLEDSAAASLSAGEAGLLYAEVTPIGATRTVVAQGDLGAAVSSADLALGADGALIAYSQGDEVLFVRESAGGLAFDAPVLVSDSSTLAPSQVRLARLSTSQVVVVWTELSDRDGVSDDVDVVARVIDEDGGALGPVVLVSAGASDSVTPQIAALDQDTVVIGYLEAEALLLGSADVAGLAAGLAPAVADASAVTGGGAASAFSIAASDNALVVCWLDDGPALVGAVAWGLVVRSSTAGTAGLGAASVVSSGAVSAASCGLAGDVVHASWLIGGTLYLQPWVIQ